MATDTSTTYERGARGGGPGTDLLIVGTRGGGGIHQYVDEQADRLPDHLSVRIYDMETPDAGSGPVWFVASFLRSLVALLKFPFRRTPDVVHVHTSHRFSFYRAAPYVLFAAHVWKLPVVLHVHGSSFDDFARTDDLAVRWLQRVVFDASDRIVVLSGYWRDVLSETVPVEKIAVLPNAVDPAEYDPIYGGEPPHLVFVSNLIDRKGVNELCSALETLAERGVAYRATIAGKGPLADRVERLAADSPNVEYAGYVSEARKRALLETGTIYVLPTYAEGLPIAMLEGMAGGNAVVSTRVGSIPEVIDAESGILLEPGDSEGLADALETLVTDPERTSRMGRRNRDLVETEYSWARTTDRLEELYADIRTAPGGRAG